MDKPTPYSFHRADGFCVLEFKSDAEAKRNGECNPGTLQVINELTGETVFTLALGNN